MLRTRILSAIVLIPLVLYVLYLGGWWFLLAIGIILSLGVWEFARLMEKGGQSLFLPVMLLLVWVALVDVALSQVDLLIPGLALVLVCSLIWAMDRFNKSDANPIAAWALTVVGGLYLSLMGSHFLRLRTLDDGWLWSLTAYGSTWLADSGAYFVGRAWGRRKLAPKLSPGKTWEGSLGGLLAGALSGAILALLFGLGAWHGLALGALIAVISPVGDLGISMIKRHVGAKDSSNLIPGHGGVLDKIDSLLISVTIATYYVGQLVL
jgi:phosphatidate cytidylyltransferase